MKTMDVNERIWRDLLNAAVHDDGAAATEHLRAGYPVYYVEDDTPEDLLVKEYPDGRRQWVVFDEAGDFVVKSLPPTDET